MELIKRYSDYETLDTRPEFLPHAELNLLNSVEVALWDIPEKDKQEAEEFIEKEDKKIK